MPRRGTCSWSWLTLMRLLKTMSRPTSKQRETLSPLTFTAGLFRCKPYLLRLSPIRVLQIMAQFGDCCTDNITSNLIPRKLKICLAHARQVGSIASNFHAVSLGLKSVFDGSNMEEDDKPHSEKQGSAWVWSITERLSILICLICLHAKQRLPLPEG